jgi:carbamoyl-phosphate synthase large subunit
VVKIPRFQLEKFPGSDPRLGIQMKSVGEVMAIGRSFKEALGKAMRSLELDATPKLDFDHLREYLATPTPERLSYLFAALRRGFTIDDLHDLTNIDRWFLSEMAAFISLEGELRDASWEDLTASQLTRAKAWGFSDLELRELFDRSEDDIRQKRIELGVLPMFKMVDTCAAEFEAATPYFYSTYAGQENESIASSRPKVLILGSGPNRIGQGIEFDYANVHASWALQEEGYQVLMVNSNPETVSTDYDTSDRLYFEPLTAEDVLAIIENERPTGVVVGFGGQTPLKLARKLVQEGIPLLGTSFEAIELAENRERFGEILTRLELKSPPYGTATTVEQALGVAEQLGYPVLIRPSYILGGRAVKIVDGPSELGYYVTEAARISDGYPVLIDRFIDHAIELDVDVLSDGEDVWIAGLMEQIEAAGVHSGDSACVLPPVTLSSHMVSRIEHASARLVRELGVRGLTNLQIAIKGDDLYVLEANPRASRTVPFVSKAIGIPIAKLAAKILVGKRLRDLLAPYWPYRTRPGSDADGSSHLEPSAEGVLPTPWPRYCSVKEVVLPFSRFPGADTLLGPEMLSTGEIMSIGRSFPEAFAKAQIAAANPLPTSGTVLVSLADSDKHEGTPLVAQLYAWGFEIVATNETARTLRSAGIPTATVLKVGEGRPDVVDWISQGKVDLAVNTPSPPQHQTQVPSPPLPAGAVERGIPIPLPSKRTVGYRIRTAALEYGVPYVTTLLGLQAAVSAIRFLRTGRPEIMTLDPVNVRLGGD